MKHDRRNFYRILHLQPDAPPAFVRHSFRTLMHKLRVHPDLGGDHCDAAQVSEAYAILSDPVRRAAYDEALLAAYDLATLSEGRAGGGRRQCASRRRKRHGNRRSFYRVLRVQRDAPVQIIQASHGALEASGELASILLEEALIVLADAARRRVYDEALPVRGHAAAAALALGEVTAEAEHGESEGRAYDPRIMNYCAFCKTPHGWREDAAADARCAECASPLASPPDSLLGLARRAVARLQRDEPVYFHEYWPGERREARLLDLSPTGLRMATGAPAAPGDHFKLDAQAFQGVGVVSHCTLDGSRATLGLRFLTVRFREERGSFVSISA